HLHRPQGNYYVQGPETQSSQQEVYDHTIREMVRDVLRGENRLLYTYGVTNSGKTYTIQGAGGEAGLLPRGLVSVFLKLSGRLYSICLRFQMQNLGECDPNPNVKLLLRVCVCPPDSDGVCLEANGLCLSGGEDLEEGVQFSVWVSFYEIYNEFLYDLLDAPPSLQSHKRATLRLSDDKHGNPYVKDLTWIQVRSAEEAWKVLKAGQRNQSFASTHLNHNSSRRYVPNAIKITLFCIWISPSLCCVSWCTGRAVRRGWLIFCRCFVSRLRISTTPLYWRRRATRKETSPCLILK
uniref:Kinesin-like protein KIF20A n=1 Tax=Sinocyclocheilus grahami TaxID=75366 RepID=A0A672LV67_SINGR